ncbi:hypothetical protein Ga0061079_1243 [Apibacter mensalis]|uniref:Uncharacterized protein n=1 Tax=Apibacter mensalis TaxID=1586267 RepID=A0A0X3ASA0_9FLAO|nr:hypothetical protein [Apibacter mensalis]CVK17214.1 hypothetical protein Ga0061079_1243 [Apibacter mensalis]
MKFKIIISIFLVIIFCYLLTPYPLNYIAPKENREYKILHLQEDILPKIDSLKTIAAKNVDNIKAKKKVLLNSEEKKNKVLSKLKDEIVLVQKEIEDDLKKDKEIISTNNNNNNNNNNNKSRKNKTSKN